MQQQLEFEGYEYSFDSLSNNAKGILVKMNFAKQKIVELKDNSAVLNKAKNGYIEDLKNQIVSGKLGVDLGDLLTD
jgi:hypothetical protein